jgi:calcium-dependent protein kinase
MQDILYAISYCHEEKIAHNDIRPENLVLDDEEEYSAKLKLIDFGISSEEGNHSGKYGQYHFRAPETFNKTSEVQNSDNRLKSDVWSAGVVFYILMKKESLFKGKDKVVKQSIQNFKTSTLDEKIDLEVALDLLKQMLDVDPTSRITARKALKHNYFKEFSKKDENLKEDIKKTLKTMSRFQIEKSFDIKMMSLVAVHISSSTDEKVKSKLFKAIDSKHDGYINKKELLKISKEIDLDEENSEDLADKIIKNCDLDRNGRISYTEFLTTSLNWKALLSNDLDIDKILSYFDIVRKEYLTEEELLGIIKLNKTKELSAFLQKYKDNNGLISKSKLKTYFLDISQTFITN